MKWNERLVARLRHYSPFEWVYQRLTSTSPLMLQWGRLFLWILLLIPFWVVKYLHNATSTQDGIILLTMSAIFGAAFLIMLWENEVRTIRNLGLMSVFLGLCLLFAFTGLPYFDRGGGTTESELDVVRTLYIVGGFAFIYGALNAVLDWEFNRKHIALFVSNLALIITLLMLAFRAG
jgi:hypothetical protein